MSTNSLCNLKVKVFYDVLRNLKIFLEGYGAVWNCKVGNDTKNELIIWKQEKQLGRFCINKLLTKDLKAWKRRDLCETKSVKISITWSTIT